MRNTAQDVHMYTHMHTYTHTYIHTYTYTYIHTYIHIHSWYSHTHPHPLTGISLSLVSRSHRALRLHTHTTSRSHRTVRLSIICFHRALPLVLHWCVLLSFASADLTGKCRQGKSHPASHECTCVWLRSLLHVYFLVT